MSDETTNQPVIVYTSNFCAHSWTVERFMRAHNVAAEYININRDAEARSRVMELNRGYASVPTLVFADGSHLTEPSLSELSHQLGIYHPSLWERLRGWLRLSSENEN